MVVDIRYHAQGPEQVQGVRLISVYTQPTSDGTEQPEIILHFYDSYGRPARHIPISEILDYTVSQD